MKSTALVVLIALSATGCATIHNSPSKSLVPPVPGDIVGTEKVCPSLNAHKKKACRFDREQRLTIEESNRYLKAKGPADIFGLQHIRTNEPLVLNHGFQVWPDRMVIEETGTPGAWLVRDNNHPDGMFDHTLNLRKDDHVTFKCIISSDGSYHGPYDTTYDYGGVVKTYGLVITGVTTTSLSIAGALTIPVIGGAIGAGTGLLASEALKKDLSRVDDSWWEREAGDLAEDICKTLATKAKMKN